jgi:hypothetical protein
MNNHIFVVKEVVNRMQKNYQEGVDPISRQQIPLLMKRIFELEQSLAAFARIGSRVQHDELPMQTCYTSDCVRAAQMLDENNTYRPNPQAPSQEIPATLF